MPGVMNNKLISNLESVFLPTIDFLIIDDRAEEADFLKGNLNGGGYVVHVAQNSEEAMAFTRLQRPCLILLSTQLAGEDGIEICRRLKDDPITGRIPIIAICDLHSRSDQLGSFQAGALDFITRPLVAEEVSARIRTHVESQRMKVQLEQLSASFEEAPVAYALIDRHFKILRINHKGAALLGMNHHDPLVDPFTTFLHPEYQALFSNAITQAVQSRSWVTCKVVLRLAEGRHVWVRIEIMSLQGGNQFQLVVMDITEQQQNEINHIQTNAFLENLINYANAPIIVWDAQQRIIRFNHAFEVLTGRKEQDVLGQSLEFLFPADQVNTSMELIGRTAGGERWNVVELKIRNLNGEIHTVLWNSATLFFPDGITPNATIAQGQDITERKKMESELIKSEQRWRSLVLTIPDFIAIHDKHGNFEFLNQYAEGFSEKDVIGHNVSEFVAADYKQLFMETLEKTLKAGTFQRFEHQAFGSNREWRYYEDYMIPLTGQDLDKVLVVSRDITDSKLSMSLLKESEEKYRQLFENSLDAVFITEPNGAIGSANPAACRMFDRTEEEIKVLGRAGLLDTTDPRLAIALAERQRTGRFKGELTGISSDGSKFPIEVTSSVFFNREGKQHTSLIIRDISQRVKVELELKAALEHLRHVSARHVDVQENERRAIARRLHDQVGQSLTALGISINIIRKQVE